MNPLETYTPEEPLCALEEVCATLSIDYIQQSKGGDTNGTTANNKLDG